MLSKGKETFTYIKNKFRKYKDKKEKNIVQAEDIRLKDQLIEKISSEFK